MTSDQEHNAEKPDGFEVVYAGDDINVVGFGLDQENVLMGFTRYGAGRTRPAFSPSLARAYGWGYIGMISRDNHWWQVPDFPLALRASKHALPRKAKIVTYGLSMGGAGAILASQFLNVHRCVAVAPPLIVHGNYSPWEKRFSKFKADCELLYVPNFKKRQPRETFIVYDPFMVKDRLHIDKMADNGLKIKRLPLPFSGHTPLTELEHLGKYATFTDQGVMKGDYDATRALLRSCRDQRGLFSFGRIMKQHRRGKLTHDQVANAISALMEKHGPERFLAEARCEHLFRARRLDEALRGFEQLYAETKGKKYLNWIEDINNMRSEQNGCTQPSR